MRSNLVLSLAAAMLFVLVAVNAIRAADVQIKEGTVVSVTAITLVIVDPQNKQQSFQVDKNVPVRVNGKPGKLEDLKMSTPVKVTIDKQGKVMSVATVDTRKLPAQ